MRFGRKLALQVTSDQTGAPYLSHKAMKEAINKTVRDLRLYQSRSQSLENFKAGMILPEGEALPTVDELAKLEEQIKDFDKELFSIVEEASSPKMGKYAQPHGSKKGMEFSG
eukprot:symbB.v1.2.022148.t1/scaffold1909.1/size96399/12